MNRKTEIRKAGAAAAPSLRAKHPCETAADVYLIILFFAFPLFPGFLGYTEITISKYLFFVTATLLWLAVTAALCIRRREAPPRPGAPQIAALVFAAVCLLSALVSPFFPETLPGAGRYGGILTIALYVLVFLGVSAFTRPKTMHLWALAGSVTLCCLVAALQLLGGNPLRLYPDGLGYADAGLRYSGVYLGTIGNTNLNDAFFCMTIPLFFVALLRSKRLLTLLPLLAALAVTLLTGGSGAALALAVTGLAAMLLLPQKRKWRIVFGFFAAALLVGVLLLIWFWPAGSGTLFELSQLLHGKLDDSFGSSRILIWRKCLALFSERPILGGGPDTLPLRLDIQFSRFVPETGVTLKSYVDNAHNVYLGYLTDCGVLGLAAYLSLLIACFIRLLRRKGRCGEALLLSLLCACVQAFFGLGLCLTEPVFFALLGLAASKDDV